MKNLNLLFNKTYYEDLGKESGAALNESIAKKNDGLFSTSFEKSDYTPCAVASSEGYTSFLMQTRYPGVLVGTGYVHSLGESGVDEDINCGFSFDYVTGQPYIPGSSVKGILRSAFRKDELEKFISGICDIQPEETKALKKLIFGESAEEGIENGDDIFLDAVVRHGGAKKQILASDYITPHNSPIKNPVPIHVIKILPEVVFEFRFVLKPSRIGEKQVTAEKKIELFKSIIELMGVGAKTNVGYGIMMPYDEASIAGYWTRIEEAEREAQREAGANNAHNNAGGNNTRNNARGNNAHNNAGAGNIQNISNIPEKPEVGKTYTATVMSIGKKGVNVRITVGGKAYSGLISNDDFCGKNIDYFRLKLTKNIQVQLTKIDKNQYNFKPIIGNK